MIMVFSFRISRSSTFCDLPRIHDFSHLPAICSDGHGILFKIPAVYNHLPGYRNVSSALVKSTAKRSAADVHFRYFRFPPLPAISAGFSTGSTCFCRCSGLCCLFLVSDFLSVSAGSPFSFFAMETRFKHFFHFLLRCGFPPFRLALLVLHALIHLYIESSRTCRSVHRKLFQDIRTSIFAFSFCATTESSMVISMTVFFRKFTVFLAEKIVFQHIRNACSSVPECCPGTPPRMLSGVYCLDRRYTFR